LILRLIIRDEMVYGDGILYRAFAKRQLVLRDTRPNDTRPEKVTIAKDAPKLAKIYHIGGVILINCV
jgi:hypothetical protein